MLYQLQPPPHISVRRVRDNQPRPIPQMARWSNQASKQAACIEKKIKIMPKMC